MDNLICLLHPKYDGKGNPALSCKVCCGRFIAAIKDGQPRVELTRSSRVDLYVNHQTGKVTARQHSTQPDLGDRLKQIRASMDRINSLMAALKPLAEDDR